MTFTSYAQNFEDVMLRRAFGGFATGFYIDVGAWDPDADSVTRTFYDAGWHGINIEPVPALHAALARRRPRDVNLAVAVMAEDGTVPFHVLEGTGLSTIDAATARDHVNAGYRETLLQVQAMTLSAICRAHAPPRIHFLKIDCEGGERGVLLGADFVTWRPWIIVIEAVKPNQPIENYAGWEPLLTAASYHFVWFDGLNRFYVAAEWHHALACHFTTPPNVFDNFVRARERPAVAHRNSCRPSLAAVTPRQLTTDARIELARVCRDADALPKVAGAGEVFTRADGTRVQRMHNGLNVVADGYCGAWMTRLINLCAGHHEPQEERLFHAVLPYLPPNAAMIELGGFWSYYTAWFLQGAPDRRALVLEPDPAHIAVGRRNLALNELSAIFVDGFAGATPAEVATPFTTEESGVVERVRFSVPQLLAMLGRDRLDVLHCDIQGGELDVLEGARDLLVAGDIGWVFISTHAHTISGDPLTHQRCLSLVRQCGGVIEGEHDIHESYSGDGLIVARFGPTPSGWRPVPLSRARYSESLFRNPAYDLAEELERDAMPNFAEDVVTALYRSLLLREPDQAGLSAHMRMLGEPGSVADMLETFLHSSEFIEHQLSFRARYFNT